MPKTPNRKVQKGDQPAERRHAVRRREAAAEPQPSASNTTKAALEYQLQAISALALLVLKSVMLDHRASASSRIRAARTIIEISRRQQDLQQREARVAQLERLDPQEAALRCLAQDELLLLKEYMYARAEGTQLIPDQIAILRKYEALVHDFQARKLGFPSGSSGLLQRLTRDPERRDRALRKGGDWK